MIKSSPPKIIVIGAGSTGSAIAHDLALRGARVTVVERGEVASGATGRNHCLLHSGARYCVTDPESGRDCRRENAILRRIWPDAMECNGGLFVAFEEQDLNFRDAFLEGCSACEIPARVLSVAQARALEPNLHPNILAAVLVPDGAFEPYRLCLAFLASAQRNGATLRTFSTVRELLREGHQITGARIKNILDGREEIMGADLVINAAGAWAGQIAALADVSVPLAPCAGVLVTVARRWTQRVINRLRPPSDGDVVLPIRGTSIVGTTSWMVDLPDGIIAPADQVERMLDSGERMLPGFRSAPVRGIMAGARPLAFRKKEAARGPGLEESTDRALSRECACVDHALDGTPGLMTVIGGKTTTARGMAQQAADMACAFLGLRAECRTMETLLADYHEIHAPPSPPRGGRRVDG
jgi:glycerol-3-phosphate dehydrogenase